MRKTTKAPSAEFWETHHLQHKKTIHTPPFMAQNLPSLMPEVDTPLWCRVSRHVFLLRDATRQHHPAPPKREASRAARWAVRRGTPKCHLLMDPWPPKSWLGECLWEFYWRNMIPPKVGSGLGKQEKEWWGWELPLRKLKVRAVDQIVNSGQACS